MEPRALESAFRVASLAKLEPGSLQPKCQALRFSAGDFTNSDQDDEDSQIILLEVPSKVADQLEQGDHFVFRGDADDSVVLCSNNEIFDVKEAETSNSLLIVKNLLTNEKCQADDDNPTSDNAEENAHEVTVMKSFHRYLEMKSLMPNYQKLIQVLEDKYLNSYPVDDINEHSVNYSDLLNSIQCSETELVKGLKSMDAIQIGQNSWTVVTSDMRMRVVSMICNVISENSWSWDDIPKNEAIETLRELEDEVIINQVFDQYIQAGKFLRNKLCRFYGEYLLQSSTAFNLMEFLSIWQDSLPKIDNENEELFKVDLNQLEGLSLVIKDQIQHFPETKLPNNIQDRLKILFNTKDKWSLDEITPFVKNMTTPKLNVKALLTKYARACNENGQKMFTSKHIR